MLADLPPREYVLRVWQSQMIDSEESKKKTVDLARSKHAEVEWALKLKSEVKVRRAPAADRGGGCY